VPQLVTRIEGLPDRPLLLAGHSQGSILCAATVAQLSQPRRREVFLLTFGTQLTRLYGRAFPAFFARTGRYRLATLLGGHPANQPAWSHTRWRSLYRNTDILGWPISATHDARDPHTDSDADDLGRVVDVRVQDPIGLNPITASGLEPVPGEITDPVIFGHSDYPLSPEYATIRTAAAARLLRPDAGAQVDGSSTFGSVPWSPSQFHPTPGPATHRRGPPRRSV
jgi:hypothetical protein